MKKPITYQLEKGAKAALLLLLVSLCLFSLYSVSAAPQGATVSAVYSVDPGPNKSAGSLTHPGGRIVTVGLNLEQQNQGWKAYIGNVSGIYVLQNANNASIYEWPLSTVGGEVYISRNSTVNFGSVRCANTTTINAENSFLGYSPSDSDSINMTFNASGHRTFLVGNVSIGPNNCSSLATWVNDTQQSPTSSAIFQEVLLDDTSNVVYTALINNDRAGFDNTTATYDFQAIIAENRTGSGTTYYFYVELG